MLTFLRAVAGLALGLIVLAGLLYLLVAANITKRLEDPRSTRQPSTTPGPTTASTANLRAFTSAAV